MTCCKEHVSHIDRLDPGHGYDGFCATTSNGVDLQQNIPLERWALDPLYSPDIEVGKLYVRFATNIDGVQSFDKTLFKLSHAEATSMDPQSRILLEEVCGSFDPNLCNLAEIGMFTLH